MEDVKLVIKIPKEAYELLRKDGVDWLGAEHILNAVANGKPLPKKGRFVDISKIEEDRIDGDNPIIYLTIDGVISEEAISLSYLYNLPPIIEEDESESEKER